MILQEYKNHPLFAEILENIQQKEYSKLFFKGLLGSSASLLIANLCEEISSNKLIIIDGHEAAAYFYNDLSTVIPSDKLLFLPSSYKRMVKEDQKDTSAMLMRTDALSKIANGRKNYTIVTYTEALSEKVVSKSTLESNTLPLKVGLQIDIEFIVETLYEYNFEKVDFVFEPGQFAVRGGIVDIFSFSSEFPIRIDFFGDEIDSLKTFDIENQLSIKKLTSIAIIPDLQTDVSNEKQIPFYNFIKENTLVFAYDIEYLTGANEKLYIETDKNFRAKETTINPAEYLLNIAEFLNVFEKFKTIEFGARNYFNTNNIFEFNTSLQPNFNKNFELLYENFLENTNNLYRNIVFSENSRQIERLRSIFDEKQAIVEFELLEIGLHNGFVDNDLRIVFYTDHQIFERYHKYKLKTKFSRKASFSLSELNSLQKGDYVVHQDHGIGVFGGLMTLQNNGKPQEVIKLIYKNSDELFVSIHSLHRISRYKSKEGSEPKIYQLGSGAWEKLKKKTKSKVKDIAKELIELYAKRRQQKGFAFSPDTFMQDELEASFFFEDTPDQEKATKAFKEDMESDTPMDRLVCGDVGFGKTEIAIRAAFKAVADSKQVAILVPTTILAFQHYNTFKDRLRDFPVNINYLSRLRTAKKQNEIKKDLTDGKIDIIIGTHKIVGKDIKFKDLGLLIIDEEQKFGVAVKEKLRNFKLDVDTLTLTATPIPRTLQFSMMGARDLSVINTAPTNRYPIQTEVHTFNEDIIREAINYEIDRGGQVFFIHNRVQNIYEVEAMIKRICPGVKTVVGHGQMEGAKLEKLMLDFIDGDFGVLIATTIIESGLDIPNANTIIINNAQNFGLSTLHQLRGRVGRTNKKAFAYFLAPPPISLSGEARRRLKAIQDFSELGSGFNIALQDLDIRGAGNLLGGEQSGFIADIGFDTYHKILNEAIQEIKEQEYKELLTSDNEKDEKIDKDFQFVTNCQIDTDLEILFPHEYIESISERIKLYRELDSLQTEEEVLVFEKVLIDRFGKIPNQTIELIDVVRLRWKAISIAIEKIIIKNGKMICYFISDNESPFYQSHKFVNIINQMHLLQKVASMKEKNGKNILAFDNVKNIEMANRLMQKLV